MNATPLDPAARAARRTIGLLNRALATELVSMIRYQRHSSVAADVYSSTISDCLLQQAAEECGHAERIARRIVDLGGVPDFRLETLLARSFVDYMLTPTTHEDDFLPALLDEDLVAEEIAADAYREIIEELGDRDPVTCALLAEIVAVEEAHAAGLDALLNGSQPVTRMLC